MRIDPLGESAVILRELDRPAYEVAASLRAAGLSGVLDIVPSYDTIGIVFDPILFNPSVLFDVPLPDSPATATRLHRIPVDYSEGLDLDDVCQVLNLTRREFIAEHTAVRYRCFSVGFTPGFPYLGYLSERISGIPRHAQPRIKVRAGSVAITGRQTGIYPIDCPGGWAIVGWTAVKIADPANDVYLFEAGDEVEFVDASGGSA